MIFLSEKHFRGWSLLVLFLQLLRVCLHAMQHAVSHVPLFISSLSLNQVLVKGKGKSRAHSIPKSSGLKKLVRGAAAMRRHTIMIARQAMLDPEIRVQVLVLIVKTRIQKEMTTLCSKRCD